MDCGLGSNMAHVFRILRSLRLTLRLGGGTSSGGGAGFFSGAAGLLSDKDPTGAV